MEDTKIPTITRKFEFDYGHRVFGHEGKCKHIHGHRGVAEVTVYAPTLDNIGRVIDFSVLKSVVGKWIDSNWDHNYLCHQDDPLLRLLGVNKQTNLNTHSLDAREVLGGVKLPFIFPYPQNPTAENMAKTLFNISSNLLFEPYGITVMQVRLYETPNSFADYGILESGGGMNPQE